MTPVPKFPHLFPLLRAAPEFSAVPSLEPWNQCPLIPLFYMFSSTPTAHYFQASNDPPIQISLHQYFKPQSSSDPTSHWQLSWEHFALDILSTPGMQSIRSQLHLRPPHPDPPPVSFISLSLFFHFQVDTNHFWFSPCCHSMHVISGHRPCLYDFSHVCLHSFHWKPSPDKTLPPLICVNTMISCVESISLILQVYCPRAPHQQYYCMTLTEIQIKIFLYCNLGHICQCSL